MADIPIYRLTQNNLKRVAFRIPKGKITVFTDVSGSDESSIIFGTIVAEPQQQMNVAYPVSVRSRLPKYPKPATKRTNSLTAPVVVDQSSLGENTHSTVGTISGLYVNLCSSPSRVGKPYAGTASYFLFNDPNGMCRTRSNLGKTTKVDVGAVLDMGKSWDEGCARGSFYRLESWYWKQYTQSGLFNLDESIRAYFDEECSLLLYGSRDDRGEPGNSEMTKLYCKCTKMLLNRDINSKSRHIREKSQFLIVEIECTDCHGKRLNGATLDCEIKGYHIADLCCMELIRLREVLAGITGQGVSVLVQTIIEGLDGLTGIGPPYLHLNRETPPLSGGETQRLKLVRYMGSSLTGLTYIFDELSAGMHPRSVCRMNNLLWQFQGKGNTALAVEHDEDVASVADHVADVGPGAG